MLHKLSQSLKSCQSLHSLNVSANFKNNEREDTEPDDEDV
jgi:hypothetical protein